jgi:hypothetical protein
VLSMFQHASRAFLALTKHPDLQVVYAPGRIRTCDPRIRSPPLCPLSYGRLQRG